MRSTLLLLSGLVATAFSAAVPVERDALVAREKETVTVIVTVTSTTTRSSSTKRTTAQPTATVVYVTVTSFYTSQYPITSAPATYTGWTGFHPPWWSWFTASNHPVTVTDSIGPVTVYSPIYVTVTETDPGDDNYAATVTLPALTVPVKRDEGKHTHWHPSWSGRPGYTSVNPWYTSVVYPPQETGDPDSDSSVSTVYVYPPQTTISTVYVQPPQPITSTITEYVSVQPSVQPASSSDVPRITFYPPRNAAPEPQTFGLGPPSRTVQESPTPPLPPWWNWWPTATPFEIIDGEEKEKREPQELGPVSRTVQESPTPPLPPWWNWWPTPTATPFEIIDRDVNEKREPQELGSPSRTVQESPTPPLPPWWNWWPTATPFEIIDRETEEKREPQTLDFGSRTVNEGPESSTIDWTFWDPPLHPGHKHTSTAPYEIDATATLSMLTIYEKREPQTIGPISRTNQITPVEPTHHHHRTSTVYVTVTEIPYVSTSTPHHHPHSVTTYTIIVSSSTDDSYPSPTGTVIETTVTLPFAPTSTGSDIDATVTLPFISSATETDDATTVTEFVINTPTPLAKRDAEPQLPDSFTLGWPISATYISPPKENPCQNNIFAPPEWCSNGSPTFGITTVTVTYTGTVFENTATLAPLTIGEPGWGRRDKRSRLRAEVEEKERRQQLLGTQTRSFTYAPGTSAPPLV